MTEERNLTTFSRRTSGSTTDSESYKIEEREGGLQAWLTIAGSFIVYYSSFGLIGSFGFFQDYYQNHFLRDTKPSTIAFIGTLQIALVNCLATVSGALCDSYGVKYLYIGAGTTTSTALLALSFISSGNVWKFFLCQGLLLGTAIAFGVQPALTVAGQHFKIRRALAMGIAAAGSSLGGVCFPIMLRELLPVIGFHWALRVAALKIVVCYAIALSLSTSKNTWRNMRDVCGSLLDFRGFLDLRYSTLALGAWIAQFGIWVPNYYIESYCSIIAPTTPIQGYFLPLMNANSFFGMIVGGLLGDRIGRLNLLWPTTLLLGILCIMWLFSNTILFLIPFACLFGFCSGIYFAILPPVVSQISPDQKIGARIGAFYSVVAIASLVGAPIGGALIKEEKRDGYRGVTLYATGTLVLGSVIMLGARLLHDRSFKTRW